jgi:aminoglycoside phosphotransferase (APT) family kinase protein
VEIGWALFEGASRAAYREALGYDDDTWRRSRGWAVRSVTGVAYYEHTNPGLADRCARSLDAVIADWLAAGGAR